MLRTEGIVLNEIRYKDTSKILNIYTKKLGKISLMAQGAYKPKSVLIATTQIFSYSEFNLQRGRNFYYINQADIIDSFYSIRENIERVFYGSYILELIDKSTPIEEENDKLFLLLEKGLKTLSELEKDYLKFIVSYELKFISFLGYRPYLNNCVLCNNEDNNMRFSFIEGGLICKDCFKLDPQSRKIDKAMFMGMNNLLYTSLDELDSINIGNDTLWAIHKILVDYILHNIDRKQFNSLILLDSILY